MKRSIALILTLLLVLPAYLPAQSRKPRVPRKEILAENEKLRASVDSLVGVIDSIRRDHEAVLDSLSSVVTEAPRRGLSPRVEYDCEVSDSLLSLWYENTFDYNFNPLNCSRMDSAGFSSSVPDEVLMKRLASMNSYLTLPFNETVKNYMVMYSERMPSYLGRLMGLSRFYFPIIEEALDRYSLPLELKYLAVVESAFKPTARSRVGATGMWQFMMRTAKYYGLVVDSFVDERMDVEKSADAAARYLVDAYRIFGDWSLAISSYNCGSGNVLKAIRRAGSRDFWKVYEFLPRETRGYMPAIVGMMYAFTYHSEYGIEPSEVGMPAQVDTFEIHRNLHFKQINEVVGVPMEDLQNLNPKYYREIIPGNDRSCTLNLPYKWSAAFMEADIDSLYMHRSGELLSEQVMKEVAESSSQGRTAYKVKSGDYLGRIAQKYHVSVNQLMKWNHLRSTNLRVGQVLYIYR